MNDLFAIKERETIKKLRKFNIQIKYNVKQFFFFEKERNVKQLDGKSKVNAIAGL